MRGWLTHRIQVSNRSYIVHYRWRSASTRGRRNCSRGAACWGDWSWNSWRTSSWRNCRRRRSVQKNKHTPLKNSLRNLSKFCRDFCMERTLSIFLCRIWQLHEQFKTYHVALLVVVLVYSICDSFQRLRFSTVERNQWMIFSNILFPL